MFMCVCIRIYKACNICKKRIFVNLCMYMNIHTYIYDVVGCIYIHTFTVYIHTFTVCIHTFMLYSMHVCISGRRACIDKHAYMYVYIYVCICMYVCMSGHRACIDKHAYILHI